METKPSSPWYRHPWPWILMAGPAAVVVAGTVTMVIAFRNADPLIAKDSIKSHMPAKSAMSAP